MLSIIKKLAVGSLNCVVKTISNYFPEKTKCNLAVLNK